MASSEILSQTLSSITSIKLDQLRKQKEAYETKKRSLLDNVASEKDTSKRAKSLLEGAGKLPSMAANPMLSAFNLKRFVEQSDFDPSVSEVLLRDYELALRNELDVQSNKYEFASLYGKLVNEWIDAGKTTTTPTSEKGGEDFVKVGREEMHKQRAMWEEYVFKPKETEAATIKAYLEGIFENEESKDVEKALEGLRQGMKQFQEKWEDKTHFNEQTLSHSIKGMLRSDQLNDEKKATLRDFLGNSVVLSEIADVLNMRMSTRSNWAWDAPAVVDQRRNLNGRYRFYLDEDLLHSIFIYYIGREWAVQLREQLIKFVQFEGVWKLDTKPISKADARRRRFFLGDQPYGYLNNTVQALRQQHFKDNILFDQLPTQFEEVRGSYGDDSNNAEDTRSSHTEVVQDLLHRIATEILIQTKALDRDLTVIRSDFKWFGPSIPHSSLFAVLDYFGVSAEWIDLFRRILEAPLRFSGEDTEGVRRRGTPLSTPIADFFGEALLFPLDFAVNQKADGAKLYRLHDDMWLWGNDDKCARAWEVVTEFTAVMGLDINEDKTGCARIRRRGSQENSDTVTAEAGAKTTNLPTGEVTWGFLRLDPSTGRFLIRQDEVDKHISELRLQLTACRSVFDWIQAWNIYGSRFFATNFGKPATCYGRAHIDSMLSTFRKIQQQLFPDHDGSASEYLKDMIASRFPALGLNRKTIPDGYLYFPVSMGGLGLRNPFIDLLLVRGQTEEDAETKIVEEYIKDEEQAYRRAKAKFEEMVSSEDSSWQRNNAQPEFDDLRDQPFMEFEEFARYRERSSQLLGRAYQSLMERPDAVDVELKGEVKAALDENTTSWYDFSSYERWVVQLFHKEMVARFGGLRVVDKGLLPTGLMGMLRQSRFRWQV